MNPMENGDEPADQEKFDTQQNWEDLNCFLKSENHVDNSKWLGIWWPRDRKSVV